jgi:hypothetical protein
MELGGNRKKILGLQSVTGKILETKDLVAVVWVESMGVLMRSGSAFKAVEVKVI